MITLDRLQNIIPPDQALANKALATSLKQIGGINNLSLPQLSLATSAVQTTRDLPQITALTEATPASVANYYINSLATGTGTNYNIYVNDVLGTACGFVSAPALTQTLDILSGMNTTDLADIYDVMSDVVNGVYGDPVTGPVIIPSGPYAGTYTDADEVFSTQLIPAAQTEIGVIVGVYPSEVTQLNTLWDGMADQLVLEAGLQSAANLVFADLTANQKSSIYGFIYSLPSYGLDTKQGGITQFLESVCDLTTFTGQSIVACLRQAQNQRALGAAGIVVSSKIPAEPDPPPPEAVLIPSEYTEAEASDLVIR
jgi:hypothetical protein